MILLYLTDELEKYFRNEEKPKECPCQKMYNEACKSLEITPFKVFYNALATDEVRMIGTTLRPKDIKACAIALSVSKCSRLT